MTPQELKNSILQLAIQGKLVEQRAEEGTGAELLEKIFAKKNAEGAKGKGRKLPRSRGVRGGGEDEGISNLPKAAKSHPGKLSATSIPSILSAPSASPREEIPDDEKPFEIPESWEWVRLESIVNSVPSKQYQILESEVRTSGKFAVISQSKEYSIGFTDISEKVYHHVNPVIVFGDHTTEVKYVEFDFVVGADGVKIFEPLDGLLLAKYLLYVLLFNTYDLSKVGGYSRHYKFLKNKPIPLPPLAEQKRIVAKIEELMPLVDRYEKAWSRLEDFNKRFPADMQKSLLQMAIQGKLVEQRADEGTGAELLEKIFAAKNAEGAKGKGEKSHAKSAMSAKVGSRVSREEIPDDEKPFDIPESWEWTRLGEVVFNHGQKKPTEDFSYVDIGSIDNKHQRLSDAENIVKPEKASPRARKIIQRGDILYSTVRPYLHNICIVDREFSREPIASTGFAVMACSDCLDNKFLFYFLLSPDFDRYANSTENAKGVAYPAISDKRLYNALLPLPPLAEQKRIVAKLEELLPLCERLKSESNSAANS